MDKEKEEFDTLKLLSLLNNTKNHAPEDFVFSDQLLKEYRENIEKLKHQQEKVKKSYEACTGLAMAHQKKHMDIEQRKRHHQINLAEAAQLCIQNKDITANLCTCGAGKLKDRACNITGQLEKMHCRGFIPPKMLGELCGFIKIFHKLLNEKLNEPKDNSLSFLDSAFSSKCKIAENTCLKDNIDTKCTDSNENLLRTVLLNYLQYDLEIANFKIPYARRYCHFLAKQQEYLLREYHKTVNEMQEINLLNGNNVFAKLEKEKKKMKKKKKMNVQSIFLMKKM